MEYSNLQYTKNSKFSITSKHLVSSWGNLVIFDYIPPPFSQSLALYRVYLMLKQNRINGICVFSNNPIMFEVSTLTTMKPVMLQFFSRLKLTILLVCFKIMSILLLKLCSSKCVSEYSLKTRSHFIYFP